MPKREIYYQWERKDVSVVRKANLVELKGREVRPMEGMFLQQVPVLGSLVAGILLLAMILGAVVYGWSHGERSHSAAEREPIRKAA